MSPIKPVLNVAAQAHDQVKPALATVAAATSTTAQVAVITDVIQGWAAVITVVIGIPTAIMIMLYWGLKVRKAWAHRNDDTDI